MDRRGGRNAAGNRESLLGLFISSIFLTRALFFLLSRPIDGDILSLFVMKLYLTSSLIFFSHRPLIF